jgi:4-amino-4-deoxy-L-arabinose transferase-like glycosyltransferase
MPRSLRPSPWPPAAAVPRSAGWTAVLLGAIVVAAAVLRFVLPGQSPPGINQDEALSAWTAWCLLHTGRDMLGQAWPIFYSHGIGDSPSMLFFYSLMPFQAVAGLGAWSTRLLPGLAGVLSVLLVFFVGRRMFGPVTGLLAAAFLSTNPWHLYLSRFGTGASQCPLHALLVVALLLLARLPLADGPEETPRPVWAALAGLVAGLACYGFHSMKLYFPLLALLAIALNAPAWWRLWRTREGRAALLLLVAGFAVTFGPLTWRHLVDPSIAQRWQMTRLWEPGASTARIAGLVAERYAIHFQPDFLFRRGDLFAGENNPARLGAFAWYLLPCMLAGLAVLAARLRASWSARALLALLLAYPAGDVVSSNVGVHALRSAPGGWSLVLLGAWGAAAAGLWLWRHQREAAVAAIALFAVAAGLLDGRSLATFFGPMNRDPEVYHAYQTDLLEASRWLRPRLERYNEVYVTATGMNEPFAITLVGLGYDARRWFREPREWARLGDWDVCLRYGRMHFLYGQCWRAHIEAEQADAVARPVLFIVRPGELGLARPVHVIRRPDGGDALWLCEGTL